MIPENLMRDVAQDDADLRHHVRQLAWNLLDECYRILETGRPQDRIGLISRLVPPMVKALGEDDQGGRGIDALREDLRSVLQEVKNEPSPAGAQAVHPGQELQRGAAGTQLGADGVPAHLREPGGGS